MYSNKKSLVPPSKERTAFHLRLFLIFLFWGEWVLGHTNGVQGLLWLCVIRSLLIVLGGSYAMLGDGMGISHVPGQCLIPVLSNPIMWLSQSHCLFSLCFKTSGFLLFAGILWRLISATTHFSATCIFPMSPIRSSRGKSAQDQK